ncbi:hypothetical protein QR680_006441 [Steinernema hermaphroditum]|uniref:Gamma-aminobutyric acid receptor subunit beta n=1 Tax=Steinernema hermaphroditum TaxID=289476 RepID=A0AA39HWX0_9BILA|nr:hypothetical protein QR680_006441 [Steinernema hermaphroditum]
MLDPRGNAVKIILVFGTLSVLVNFQEGYSNSYPNTAFLTFKEYINNSYIEREDPKGLQEWQFTWLWSGMLNVWFLGYLVGTFATPYLNDNYGRKTSLLLSNIVSLIGTIVATSSIPLRWPELFFFSRVLASASCGVSFGSLIIFLQETTPTEQRGLTSFLSEVAFVAMDMLGMGFGMDVVLGKYLAGLIGFGAIPGILAILVTLPMKETPKYLLINRNNRKAAMEALIYYRGEREDNEKVLEEMLKESDDKIGMPVVQAIREVFVTKHLRKAFMIGVLALQMVVGNWPMMYLSTDLLEAHFNSSIAQLSSFLFTLGNFLASLCGMFCVDKYGRRPMLILFGILNILSMAGYVLFDRLSFYVHQSFSYGCIVSLVAYGVTYGGALGPIAFFITSELVPQRFRSLVQSMVFAVNTVNNFVFSFATLPAYQYFDVWSFIPLFIVPSVVCIFYLIKTLPETKGREIHEIVDDLARASAVDYSKIKPVNGTRHRPNTTIISEILSRLTDTRTYDKRLRPRYGDKPVDVGITIHVSSISAVSEVDMDFTLDFYLRQTWQDPRLAFGKIDMRFETIESLTVGVDYLERLWKPDTFFPNEKKSFFHVATTHNSFLRIDPDGTVFTSQRLTVTATCPMKLHLFPMDSQKCKLEIESYGYSVLDIIYFFNKSSESISRSEFELPQFVLIDVQISSKIEKLSSGAYSRLQCVFLFKRNIGFYIIQIYLPSILIVVISWVSFWLSRDATPARVALGVLTVLTMTTLMTTTNAAMPKVSYVKSIDIFLGVSFLMVFSSLLEYAAVGYISNPQAPPPIPPRMSASAVMVSTPTSRHEYTAASQYSVDRCLPSVTSIRPSDIDKYSRVVFPLIFVMFNFVYWCYFYSISGAELNNSDF